MLAAGDLVYFSCSGCEADVKACGWIVEKASSDVVVRIIPSAVQSLEHTAIEKAGEGLHPENLPSFGSCKLAWESLEGAHLESSEAERGTGKGLLKG